MLSPLLLRGLASTPARDEERVPRAAAVGALAAAACAALALGISLKPAELEAPSQKQQPVYTKAEVAKHKTKETRVWVTFKVAQPRRVSPPAPLSAEAKNRVEAAWGAPPSPPDARRPRGARRTGCTT